MKKIILIFFLFGGGIAVALSFALMTLIRKISLYQLNHSRAMHNG
jgi:uncharacterized membrane protein YccF (DUF307 family)